jgi:hypothetical protein
MLICVSQVSAATLVFNKTFIAGKVEVVSPGHITIVTTFGGKTKLVKFTYYIDGLDYAGTDHRECDDSIETDPCKLLREYLLDKVIQFHILKYDVKTDLFSGQLFADGENVKNEMIRMGWYRFDYKKGRNQYLAILQKEAKCNARGIWKSRFTPLTELECN